MNLLAVAELTAVLILVLLVLFALFGVRREYRLREQRLRMHFTLGARVEARHRSERFSRGAGPLTDPATQLKAEEYERVPEVL